VNRGFMKTDAQLLENISRIRHIPGVIAQGRYDVVCPMESAWALHRAWPEADLIITPDSGHSAFDPPNSRALVAATDKFAG
jgi:proline iminopeptidase